MILQVRRKLLEALIKEILEILSIEFTVMLVAALPVIELRGAIPVGISLGLSPIHAAGISFIGSMIPVPFILFTIRPIFDYMKTTDFFRKLANRLTRKSRKARTRIDKYGYLGLLLLVSIPLPGTGVWSGSLAAALLGLRFKYSFPIIFLGNMIAGLIVMSLSHGIFNLLAG